MYSREPSRRDDVDLGWPPKAQPRHIPDTLSPDPICDPFDDGDMHQYNTPRVSRRERNANLLRADMDCWDSRADDIDPRFCHAEAPGEGVPLRKVVFMASFALILLAAAALIVWIAAGVVVALTEWAK